MLTGSMHVTYRAALSKTAPAYVKADVVSTCRVATELLAVLLAEPLDGWMQHTGPTSRSATPAGRRQGPRAPARARLDHSTKLRTRNATSRDQIIRALAVDSASASLGPRDTLTAIRRSVPDASVEASTTTLAAVLQNHRSEYRALEDQADRAVSDALML